MTKITHVALILTTGELATQLVPITPPCKVTLQVEKEGSAGLAYFTSANSEPVMVDWEFSDSGGWVNKMDTVDIDIWIPSL